MHYHLLNAFQMQFTILEKIKPPTSYPFKATLPNNITPFFLVRFRRKTKHENKKQDRIPHESIQSIPSIPSIFPIIPSIQWNSQVSNTIAGLSTSPELAAAVGAEVPLAWKDGEMGEWVTTALEYLEDHPIW